jgi:hypothetical protein
VTTRQAVYFQQRIPVQKTLFFGFGRSHSLFNPAQPEAKLSSVNPAISPIVHNNEEENS